MRKTPVVLAAALLALGVAAGADGQPQGSPRGGMMGPGGMMGMDPGDWSMPTMTHMREMMMGQASMPMAVMAQHVEGRIAFLEAELRITPAQEPLWGRLAETMRANAKTMAGMMHQGGTPAQDAVPSLPERLDRQEEVLAARLDALRAMKSALTPLYAAFSDEQKRTADELIRGPMGMSMMM